MQRMKMNIPEPERYPRMTPEEIEMVKGAIVEGHKNILIAFRSDIRNFKTLYKDCYVVCTPFILYAYKKNGKKLEKMARIYLADIILIAYSKEKYLLAQSEDTSLVITAPEALRVAQILYRNYQIVFSNLTIEETCELRSYDMSLFPPIKLPLSNSQKFQFAYASLCAKEMRPFRNEVVRFLHSMVLARNGVFDISLLPVDLFIDRRDLLPVLKAVDYMKFTSGFCCVNVSQPELFTGIADIISKSTSIKILYFVNCQITQGMKQISEALKANRELPVAYWCLDQNKITDFDFFPVIVSAQKEPIRVLSLNNCGIKANQTNELFKALEANTFQRSMEVLQIHGAEFSQDCVASFDKWLDCQSDELKKLDLGGIANSGQAILSLIRRYAPPLTHLTLSGTQINLAALEDLLEFIRESKTLEMLDISGTGLAPKSITHVIEAIAENDNLKRFDLNLSNLAIHGAALMPMFGAFLDSNLEKWRSIILDENGMNATDLKNFLPLLIMMPKLKRLSLSRNFSSKTENILNILPGIIEIKSLKYLIIQGGPTMKLESAIYPLIEQISARKLKYLDLSNNGLGDRGVSLAVGALRAIPTLKHFDITDNGLRGIQIWMELADAVVSAPALVEFQFSMSDMLATIELSKKNKATIRQLTELQSSALNAVYARRRRLGLGCPYLETEDVAYLSRKFKNGSKHSAVCKEFNLPLPYQHEGEVVEDGGDITEIDIGEMAVYETDSMRYVIEEDVSAFEAPEIMTQVITLPGTMPLIVENKEPEVISNKSSNPPHSRVAFIEPDQKEQPVIIVSSDDSDEDDVIKSKNFDINDEKVFGQKVTKKRSLKPDSESEDEIQVKPKKSNTPKRKLKLDDDDEPEEEEIPKKSPKKRSIEQERKPKRRLEDSDDEEEEPKPKKSTPKKRILDSDDESPKPKKSNSKKELFSSDDDEPPKPKKSTPKKKNLDSDEEEIKPKKSNSKKPIVSSDDDEPPKPKKSAPKRKLLDSDDEEPPKPKKSTPKKSLISSDDDEPPKPKKSAPKRKLLDSDSEEELPKPKKSAPKRKLLDSDSDEEPPKPRKSNSKRK